MEFARSIVSRVRKYVGDRRKANRHRIRLPFTIHVSGPGMNPNGSRPKRHLNGHTLDISQNGLALIVPAIRIGDHHLVGDRRDLSLTLELPDGPIELQVATVRYESLEEHESESGFLIGVRILTLEDSARERFDSFVATMVDTPN